MSLYNMLCGMNPVAGRLLAAIDLHPDTIPRFRDVWVKADFTEITVHTRTGGGNREAHEAENAVLCAHPLYLRDADDHFDNTFADFTFRVPADEKAKLQAEIEACEDDPTKNQIMAVITERPRDKFDKAMAALKTNRQTI